MIFTLLVINTSVVYKRILIYVDYASKLAQHSNGQ